MTTILACSGDRFIRLDGEAGEWTAAGALEGTGARCLAVDPRDSARVFVGCRGHGLQRSDDGGGSWRAVELPEADVFSVAVSPADGAVYAGTEPSRLFVSRDGGERFAELDALQRIPSRPEWSFPPRPWTSHVRWIAPSPRRPERLLVGIELGGLMISDDGGESFADHRPGAERDVHALAWHPSGEAAYEAAGGGAAWSRDGGLSWQGADDGRERNYCWAVACDPEDAGRWYVSAAPGPGAAHGGGPADAHIYRWEGEGPWRRLDGGLPDPLEALPAALAATPRGLYAGLRDGSVYASRDRGESWERLPVELDAVEAMEVLEP